MRDQANALFSGNLLGRINPGLYDALKRNPLVPIRVATAKTRDYYWKGPSLSVSRIIGFRLSEPPCFLLRMGFEADPSYRASFNLIYVALMPVESHKALQSKEVQALAHQTAHGLMLMINMQRREDEGD